MKFLIAGFGSIGRRHLRNLRTLGEQDILLYRTNQSTLPDDEIAGLVVETDLHAALEHRPDVVIVANPTALHLTVAIPAAEAGCHLFLEKPVSHSLDGIGALQNALKNTGKSALVGFQFRFHPGLRQIAAWINQGTIGRTLSARAHWGEYLPAWHPWEDYRASYAARADLGGGVALTLCHPFDYLRWLLGEVVDVDGYCARVSDLDLQVEDLVEADLRFASGARASVHLDYFQRPGAHTLQINGTQGTIRWDNADGAAHLYRAVDEQWEHFTPPPEFERNILFLEQTRHLIDIVQGKAQPACTLLDGQRALQIALAIKEKFL